MSTTPQLKRRVSVEVSEGYWVDCYVIALKNLKRNALVRFDDGSENIYPVEFLADPIKPHINKRFDVYNRIAHNVLTRKCKAAVVVGKGGIGKSWEAEAVAESLGMIEGQDYILSKGSSTARGLFDFLNKYYNMPIIFDDFDSILKDKDALNILKSALDTVGRRRKITWNTSKKGGGEESFNFEGSILFISNIDIEDFDQPLLSRSHLIDLSMTIDELIERIKTMVMTIDIGEDLSLSDAERNELFEFIVTYKNTIFDLNLRSLVKAMQLYAVDKDMELVRTSLLSHHNKKSKKK